MDGSSSSPSHYASSPEGEIVTPMGERVAVPEYAPGEPAARSRRLEIFGAPGTYLLVGINCAVFLWMVLHGVSVQSPTPYPARKWR